MLTSSKLFCRYNHKYSEYYSLEVKKILNDDPIHSLREVYLKDRPLFFRLRDELLIKGFEFDKNFNRTLFPEIIYGDEVIVGYRKEFDKNILEKHTKIFNFFNSMKFSSKEYFIGMNIVALSIKTQVHLKELTNLLENSGFLIDLVISAEESDKIDPLFETKMINFNYESEEDLIIENAFGERKFEIFRNFCRDNKVKHTRDITENLLEKFSRKKGVGHRKITEVSMHYQNIINESYILTIEKNINAIFTNRIATSEKKEDYLNLLRSIDSNYEEFFIEGKTDKLLTYFNHGKNTKITQTKEELIKKIKETNFYTIFCNEIIQNINSINCKVSLEQDLSLKNYINTHSNLEDAKDIYNICSYYDKFDTNFKNHVTNIKQKQKYIYEQRLTKTLEELGEEQNLTRERIRQLEKKTSANVIRLFEEYIMLIEDIIRLKKISEPKTVYEYLVKDEGYEDFFIHFLLDFDLVVKNKYQYFTKYSFELCSQYVQELLIGNPITIKHNLDEYFDQKLIELVAEKHNYITEDSILFRKAYKKEKIEYIALQSEDRIIKLDKLGFSSIKAKSEQLFGSFSYNDDKDGIRALLSLIENSDKLVRIDKNSWKFFDDDREMNLDKELENKLKYYLDKKISENNVAFVKDMLMDLESDLEPYGIRNKYYLTSIVKILFGEDYSIGRRNTQSIYKIDGKSTYSELLSNIIKDSKNGISKEDMLSRLGWNESKLSQSINRTPEIVSYLGPDRKTYYILYENLELKEEQRNEIKLLVEYFRSLNNKYMAIDDFLRQLMFRSNNPDYYNNKGFLNSRTLMSEVIIREYPEYKKSNLGHLIFFVEVMTIENIIIDKFTKFTTVAEIEYFLGKLGYGKMTIDETLKNLLRNDFFRYISKEEIVNDKHFTLEGVDIEQIRILIDKEIKQKGYFDPYCTQEYHYFDLTKTEYVWTENLIVEIGKNLGFYEDKLVNETKNTISVLVKNHKGSLLLCIEEKYFQPILLQQLYKELDLENTISLKRFKGLFDKSTKLIVDKYDWLLRREENEFR